MMRKMIDHELAVGLQATHKRLLSTAIDQMTMIVGFPCYVESTHIAALVMKRLPEVIGKYNFGFAINMRNCGERRLRFARMFR